MNYIDNYKFWCNADLTDIQKNELAAIADDTEELKSTLGLFFQALDFS